MTVLEFYNLALQQSIPPPNENCQMILFIARGGKIMASMKQLDYWHCLLGVRDDLKTIWQVQYPQRKEF